MLKTKEHSDLYVQQNTWDPSLCSCRASRPPAGTRIRARASIDRHAGHGDRLRGRRPDLHAARLHGERRREPFVDPGGGDVHIIRNETGAVAKTVAVQFIPKGAERRIDATPGNPHCPF